MRIPWEGKRQDAISLYQRALLIREATLGPQHPQTSETRAHMQALRQSMDGSEKATPEEGQKTDQDE
ncbi:hypothetical protein KSF_074980 [Reticulibacter mediterranei]|uniref:Tetratricopeptide repeat protein n=1 Tax=Reticulibacter mediterranei TaxID=2778369 RepID=A0A8J3N6I5_9CHLR|nr:hypothetical protein KSF_074980 [Reticulibacter mediterranei]